jgi:hypothetical protein
MLWRKVEIYLPKSLKPHTVPPLLGQVPHFDNTGSHARFDSNQDGKVISWEYNPTTYLVSATSFNGIHIPFCGIVVLRLDCFFGGCSDSGGISFDKTLGGPKPPFTMTHWTL